MRATSNTPVGALLASFSWQELRHHPWRNVVAVFAVALGVALAFSVHLMNASALETFANAMRSVRGQPDLELRTSAPKGIDEMLYLRVKRHRDVAIASPVLETSTYASAAPQEGVPPKRQLLRIVGVDALHILAVAPDLMPIPTALGQSTDPSHPGTEPGNTRFSVFAADTVFLNASARAAYPQAQVYLQHGLRPKPLQVAGEVRAAGAPLAVMDIAAMQDFFGLAGQLSRVDIRLRPGVDKQAFVRELRAHADWPQAAYLREPGDEVQSMQALSSAYRVNLTVLALVALFTGSFLVYSVLSLSVARRSQQFALLGVLGMTGPARARLVLAEATVLGLVGSGCGLVLGTGLAALGLRMVGGDLGGGYFAGLSPVLHWSPQAAATFGALGMASAWAGAWWPARRALQLAPAQALKGLGADAQPKHGLLLGFAALLGAATLAQLPAWNGIPVAAYLSIGLILVGGVAILPALVGYALAYLAPWVQGKVMLQLAVERARRVPHSASVAMSGVVAALGLAVALTTMVGSFRTSVSHWLDALLPATLYVRTAASAAALDTAFFSPEFVHQTTKLSGVQRVRSQRTLGLTLEPTRPAVTLIVRPLREPGSPVIDLPLLAQPLAVPQGAIGIYISEAASDLYDLRPGQGFPLLERALTAPKNAPEAAPLFVAGVWRDYARQFGTIAIDQADFAKFNSDTRANELALWLDDSAPVQTIEHALNTLAGAGQAPTHRGDLLEFASAPKLRAISLAIFDRSFAVTYWLQAIAIGIGLFGVAASFSAQVLARRKEFGLLQHLGFTRRQVLHLVAAEGATWTVLGSIAGMALGLAVAAVLVYVVNPQSFHWTMDLYIPWGRLLLLAGAVVLCGTVTARLAGLAAAGKDAVLAVKEDW